MTSPNYNCSIVESLFIVLLMVGSIFVISMAVGCDPNKVSMTNIEEKEKAECTCLQERPQDYYVISEFTKHDGDKEKIEQIIKWNAMEEDVYGNLRYPYTIGYGNVPTKVYEVRLIDPGNIEYYYTWKVPSKNDQGFYEIDDIVSNQTIMILDDDSIRLKELPIQSLPLDPLSERNKEYGEVYRKARWECPIHDGFIR